MLESEEPSSGRSKSRGRIALIVVVNVIPWVSVTWWDTPLVYAFAYYWAEAVLVGAFNLIRMSRISPIGTTLLCGWFFQIHYGLFLFGMATLLGKLYAPDTIGNHPMGVNLAALCALVASEPLMWSGMLIAQVHLLISWMRTPTPGGIDACMAQMVRPYGYVVTLVGSLMVAGILQSLGIVAPSVVAFVLCCLKGLAEALWKPGVRPRQLTSSSKKPPPPLPALTLSRRGIPLGLLVALGIVGGYTVCIVRWVYSIFS